MTAISGTSRVLVLLGDPVAHSLSPGMYNAAIMALGLDAAYVALRTEANALPHVLRGLEAAGISGNVTVPHKIRVAELLIRLTSLAKDLGAVNTFWSERGRLVGDNTDVRGVLEALEPLDPEGPWLLAGTGGAARAVAGAARELGTSLLVKSRDRERARDFCVWARQLGIEARPDDGQPIGTAINATPLGLKGSDPLPIALNRLEGCRSALDLVYATSDTPWIRACRERGLLASDGRRMLVAQGVQSFERFFPHSRPPVEVMSAAVNRALKR